MPAKTGYDKFIENALKYGWMIPAGLIAIWKGSIATIPAGWVLCNGSNGTPDLRDKFIVGAKQDDSGVPKTNITGILLSTGGSKTTEYDYASLSDSGHTHNIYNTAVSYESGIDTVSIAANTETDYANVTDSGHTHEALPPFYALAFIMKT